MQHATRSFITIISSLRIRWSCENLFIDESWFLGWLNMISGAMISSVENRKKSQNIMETNKTKVINRNKQYSEWPQYYKNDKKRKSAPTFPTFTNHWFDAIDKYFLHNSLIFSFFLALSKKEIPFCNASMFIGCTKENENQSKNLNEIPPIQRWIKWAKYEPRIGQLKVDH